VVRSAVDARGKKQTTQNKILSSVNLTAL
jgi:hypothetical protein